MKNLTALPWFLALVLVVASFPIATSHSGSFVLASGRQLWAWGYNQYGELGDGTTTTRYAPVLTGITGVVDVAAGQYHSLALKSDGTVWSWGYNDHGQLGDGTITERHTPVQVTGLTEVGAVAAGLNHSFALTDANAYTLTMAQYGNGAVTPPVGSHAYSTGASVNITATPATNWSFVNWTGDVGTVADANSANTTVSMDDDYVITANFNRVAGTLTMSKSGSGNVTPSIGSQTYPVGTSMNITATPAAGWKFKNWTGDVSTVADASSANTTITMNDDYNVTANFSQATLTLAVVGGGSATPSVGSHSYPVGTSVNITATPSTNWGFVNWTGNVSTVADVNSARTNITMNSDYSVTANFIPTTL